VVALPTATTSPLTTAAGPSRSDPSTTTTSRSTVPSIVAEPNTTTTSRTPSPAASAKSCPTRTTGRRHSDTYVGDPSFGTGGAGGCGIGSAAGGAGVAAGGVGA